MCVCMYVDGARQSVKTDHLGEGYSDYKPPLSHSGTSGVDPKLIVCESVRMHVHIYIYIYMFVCVCTCMSV